MFARASRQKVHVTAVIRAFCRSAENRPNGPFRSNMAATLPRPGVNFGQQGPNYGPTWSNWSNFGPAWIQDGATSLQLGSIWEQLLPTPTWCEAVAKGAKLRHVRIDLDFHVHHMASIWNLDRFGPDFTPTWPVGPSWAPMGGGPGPSWAQSNLIRWKFAFLPLLPTFLGFDLWWGFVQSHVAHIGLVLGPTSAPDALYTGPSCARKAKLASKRAQVAPCSAPAGLARFSPLCPIPWVSAVLVKKRLKVSSFRSTANVLHSQVYTRIAWCEHCQCEPTWQSAN